MKIYGTDLNSNTLALEGVEIILAYPCEEINKAGHHALYCECNGTGQILTEAGQTIIDLVKLHGNFVEETEDWGSNF